MTTSIRNKIVRFPRKAQYLTGWNGYQTFQQIADTLSPRIAWKLKQFGVYGQDIPDSVQRSLMGLWEQLSADPNLLADTKILGGMWIALRACNSYFFINHSRRFIPFSDLSEARGYDVEEYGIDGITSPSESWNSADCHATWSAKVDFLQDITEAIQAIAREYEGDLRGLVALYILTTSAEPMATLAALQLGHSQVYSRMTDIQTRLQHLLEDYKPAQPRTWQERLEAGEVEPLLEVVEHYEDRPLALMAIYTLTTCTKVKHYAKDNNQRKMIIYYRKKVLKRIQSAYGQAAAL